MTDPAITALNQGDRAIFPLALSIPIPSPTEAIAPSGTAPEASSESQATQEGGWADKIQIFLKRVDEKKGQQDVTIVSNDNAYELEVILDGDLFLGAVQLIKLGEAGGGAGPPIDLYTPVDCIRDNNIPCIFNRVEPQQISARGYALKAKRDQRTYSIQLLPAQTIQKNTRYTLDVAWSRSPTPVLVSTDGRELVTYSKADDPDQDGDDEMTFDGQPPGTVDPGVGGAIAPFDGSPSASPDPSKDGRPAGTGAESIPSTTPRATDPAISGPRPGGAGGLSTGAKAGIAVGAVLGVLALLALIFLLLRRRKSKHVTAGGYFGDAPGSSNDLREKEAGVGIAALPVSPFSTNDGTTHDAAAIGRGNSARVVAGATIERCDGVGRHATAGHIAAAPVATAGAPGFTRKPVAQRTVSDGERVTDRDGAISAQSQVLTDEERVRWEEEERRLDEDIAEAERRRLA